MNQAITIQGALANGKAFLHQDPERLRVAEILLQHTLNVSRAYLYGHPEEILNHEDHALYQTLIQQRQQGLPVAYLIQQRSFWTFELAVSPDTLIPRPETEILVEQVLSMTDTQKPYTVLDLGTGSGAIALAIASERPHWDITACDQSSAALEIAQDNAQSLRLKTIRFIHSDWFQALAQRQFDIIVANPPYLAHDDPHLQQGDLRFEPKAALISGQDGLDDLRIIIRDSCQHLNEHGLLMVEHGCEQGDAVYKLFEHYGYRHIQSRQDWQGHDRICTGKKLNKGK